jgi:hypothetical protein
MDGLKAFFGIGFVIAALDMIGLLMVEVGAFVHGVNLGKPVTWQAVRQLGGHSATLAVLLFLVYWCFKRPAQEQPPTEQRLDESAADTGVTQVSKASNGPPADA